MKRISLTLAATVVLAVGSAFKTAEKAPSNDAFTNYPFLHTGHIPTTAGPRSPILLHFERVFHPATFAKAYGRKVLHPKLVINLPQMLREYPISQVIIESLESQRLYYRWLYFIQPCL